MKNSLSRRGLGPAGVTAVRASLPVLLVLSGLCSAADPGTRRALVCSGWTMVVEATGKEWKVVSIKPPFTGARNMVATATGGNTSVMVMGNPMTVKDTFPPGKVHITWLDSDGRSQWKQRFEINQHSHYVAYWSKDRSPERTEEGQCSRQ